MSKSLLILLIFYINTFSQSKLEVDDKYEAINSFLFTLIKDSCKITVIIKQKMSPNTVLELFTGGYGAHFDYSKYKNIEDPEFGIKKPLFNWKDYDKMRRQYRDSINTKTNMLMSKDKYWTPADFNHKNFFFGNYDTMRSQLGTGIQMYKYETQLIILSDPIYYKNKNYLVIGVTNQRSTLMGDFTSYVVVMQKINNKWVVVDKANQYWFN